MERKINSIISVAAGLSQLPLIKAARNLGYSVIAIDKNPKASGFCYASESIISSTCDAQNIIKELSKLEDRYNFNGVVARATGKALFSASAVAEKFAIPGLTKEIVYLATEKSKLREFCKSNDFTAPKGQRVRSANQIDLGFNMPIIVKPDFTLVGKKDVKVINNFPEITPAVKYGSRSSGNGFVEIEEYIDGFDIGCLFWLKNGKAKVITYWDELVGICGNGNIKGIGVSVPSVIVGSEVKKNVERVVSKFATYFGNVNALLILSFRVDMSGNLYIIELHADLGGDLIADKLFPNADAKFDYFELAISIACKKEIRLPYTFPKFKPTSMLYDARNQVAIYSSCNIESNLKETFKTIKRNKLHVIPKHYEWFKLNVN